MAEPKQFYYETRVEWTGEKEGIVSGTERAPINIGAPPEFNGRAANWSPEHLLVASVNSCFMLTLLAVAENSKVPLVSFSSSAKGKLEKFQGAGYQVTEIILKPTVVIASPDHLERMARIFEKAKENCFITNSIKSAVKLEPQVFHQQTPAAPCPLGEGPTSESESKKIKSR